MWEENTFFVELDSAKAIRDRRLTSVPTIEPAYRSQNPDDKKKELFINSPLKTQHEPQLINLKQADHVFGTRGDLKRKGYKFAFAIGHNE